MELFLQSGTTLAGNDKVRLRETEELYISEEEYAKYQQYIEKHIQTIAQRDDIAIEKKAELVYEKATQVMQKMFANPDSLMEAQQAKDIVSNFTSLVFKDDLAIASLMQLTAHDYYTHTHSINVSLYALALGTYLQLDEENIKTLGIAGLLHDLGKSRVDYEIINKNGKLSDREFSIMKKHPAVGYEIALKMGLSDKRILTGIRHHHEKMDGMGYPDGLKKEKISLFARIIGVCDVFDALTTKRSYKDAMSSFQALSIMKNQMSPHHLDAKILQNFALMLAKPSKESNE